MFFIKVYGFSIKNNSKQNQATTIMLTIFLMLLIQGILLELKQNGIGLEDSLNGGLVEFRYRLIKDYLDLKDNGIFILHCFFFFS